MELILRTLSLMDEEFAMMALAFVQMLRIFVLMLRTLSLMDIELAIMSLELVLMLRTFVLIEA